MEQRYMQGIRCYFPDTLRPDFNYYLCSPLYVAASLMRNFKDEPLHDSSFEL